MDVLRREQYGAPLESHGGKINVCRQSLGFVIITFHSRITTVGLLLTLKQLIIKL